jgi:broad specificity phosphatase PhoE
MSDLVLVRHGETEWHAENRYAGASEIELSPKGVDQAEELADWARSAGLSAVWSSQQGRALATAKPAAEVLGLQVRVDARLRELDFGIGEGLTRQEMRELFPDALRAFEADPVANHLPGGEDPVAASVRFAACLRDIADACPQDRVLVVAHATSIRLGLCRLLGEPLGAYRRLFPVIRNCGRIEVRLDSEGFRLLSSEGVAK